KVKTPSLVNLLQERGFSKTILSTFSLHIPSNKCDREQNAAGKHNECPVDGSRSQKNNGKHGRLHETKPPQQCQQCPLADALIHRVQIKPHDSTVMLVKSH